MRTITLLGATGSVGSSALDVIARHPGRYRVHALTAQSSVDALADLAARHAASIAVIGDPRARARSARRAACARRGRCRTRRRRGTRRGRARTGIRHGAGRDRRFRGAGAHASRCTRRQARVAREQGSDRLRRRLADGRPSRLPAGSCCRSTANTMRSTSACARRPAPSSALVRSAGADGLRRSVPERRQRSRSGDAGRSVRASELGHGTQDLGGLGHADEQGTRSHRGAAGCSALRQIGSMS